MADKGRKPGKLAQKIKNPRAYLNDFVQNEEGGYTYSGRRYSVDRHYADYGDVYRKFLIGGIIMLAVSVGSGMIDAAGANGAFYVILPFIGEIAAIFAILWNVARLISQGEVVKEYAFKKISTWLPGGASMLMYFALTGLIMSAVYIITHGFEEKAFKCVLYLALKTVTAFLAFEYKKYYNTVQWSAY
jgi:hypothetical protein